MSEEKLFFTIGETAQLLDVKAYVLRYWETEFKQLNPQKSETGQRVYRSKDVQICQTIKRLLYVEKYTIAGAKQKLEEFEKTGFDLMPVTPSNQDNALEVAQRQSPPQEKGTIEIPSAQSGNKDARVKSSEFRMLFAEIRKILKKYNLA
jgi:DNA-binding transcriptional MerR regulator